MGVDLKLHKASKLTHFVESGNRDADFIAYAVYIDNDLIRLFAK
jgi:hypothetical protein